MESARRHLEDFPDRRSEALGRHRLPPSFPWPCGAPFARCPSALKFRLPPGCRRRHRSSGSSTFLPVDGAGDDGKTLRRLVSVVIHDPRPSRHTTRTAGIITSVTPDQGTPTRSRFELQALYTRAGLVPISRSPAGCTPMRDRPLSRSGCGIGNRQPHLLHRRNCTREGCGVCSLLERFSSSPSSSGACGTSVRLQARCPTGSLRSPPVKPVTEREVAYHAFQCRLDCAREHPWAA